MLCKRPYLPPGQDIPVPCGLCMPCRVKRRRLWTNRLIFESMLHSHQCFVTLTYEDLKVPQGGNLVPKDVVLWLKRLRAAVCPVRLRYFLVGEYGEKTWRPHYHALLFGMPYSVQSERVVQQTWGLGFVQLGDVSQGSIRYTVGYTLKKMTRKGDPRLQGRAPEFARMSTHPGIGHAYALQLVSSLRENKAALSALANGAVPSAVLMGRKRMMLGRYLRQVVADETKLPMVSEERREAYLAELFDLCQAEEGSSLTEAVIDRQGIVNLESRERLFHSRRTL